MAWTCGKCKRDKCFANWLGMCSCLTKTYPDNERCPFYKTIEAEYNEIKYDSYDKLEGAFPPQILNRIMKEGKKQ